MSANMPLKPEASQAKIKAIGSDVLAAIVSNNNAALSEGLAKVRALGVSKWGSGETGEGLPALILAAKEGTVEAVKILMEEGPETDLWSQKVALKAAIVRSCAPIVSILATEENAREWARGGQKNALCEAAHRGAVECARALVEKKAIPPFDGDEPLRLAVGGDHVEMVEFLLRRQSKTAKAIQEIVENAAFFASGSCLLRFLPHFDWGFEAAKAKSLFVQCAFGTVQNHRPESAMHVLEKALPMEFADAVLQRLGHQPLVLLRARCEARDLSEAVQKASELPPELRGTLAAAAPRKPRAL